MKIWKHCKNVTTVSKFTLTLIKIKHCTALLRQRKEKKSFILVCVVQTFYDMSCLHMYYFDQKDITTITGSIKFTVDSGEVDFVL